MQAQNLIEIINIITDNNPLKWVIAGAEHDVICFEINNENVPVDSEKGKRLIELGCYYEEEYDCWVLYV